MQVTGEGVPVGEVAVVQGRARVQADRQHRTE